MTHYITHLAIANEIQPVFARKDILSKSGEVLLKKDQRIDHQSERALTKEPLAVPIEFCVRVEDELTANTIYELLIEFLQSDPAFSKIFDRKDLSENLKNCVDAFAFYDILRQKLSVLALQLPDVFDLSLFSAWMAVCVFEEEGYPQFQQSNAFIAAICHDFGLLEISPDILFKEGALSHDDWQSLQQHATLGADLLRHFRGIDPICPRAIEEHHESVDGTGYPAGKFEKSLCDLGRLINTLDCVNAIYCKHFKHKGRTLHDLLPVLQMTSLSRTSHFSDTLIMLFTQTPATNHTTLDQEMVPATIELAKANVEEIKAFIQVLSDFTKNIGSKHGDIKVLTIQNLAHLIKNTLSSCGIINDAYMRWLDQVYEEKLSFAYRELEDVLLMTEEIKFHILRCKRQIDSYLTEKPASPLIPAMENLKINIEKIKNERNTA